MGNDFSFQDELKDVYDTLVAYNNLKQIQNNDLIQLSDKFMNTIENSLVIAVYSLSEQLLKSTIYRCFEVNFDRSTQHFKDKFILNIYQFAAITPNLEKINKECRFFNSKFKLFLPQGINFYKKAYEEVIDARHKYAHTNSHTKDINYDYAIKFIEYLNVQYEDIQNNTYIDTIINLQNSLNKVIKVKNFNEFCNRLDVEKETIDTLKNRLYEMNSESSKYDIDYLNDIMDIVDEAISKVFGFTEYTFDEDKNEFKEILKKLEK